jgi:uncharacterized membrane protein YkvA (DUF1232 family)
MSASIRLLDTFAHWLRTLDRDARDLAALLRDDTLPPTPRRLVCGALNYLFKSLDLIPDGLDDIGYVDDTFVLRVAASLALARALDNREDHARAHENDDAPGALARLAADASVVREFLGPDHARLEAYVRGLEACVARGRGVDDIVGSPETLDTFVREVTTWADGYQAPAFAADPRTLVKLRAFLDGKLPR